MKRVVIAGAIVLLAGLGLWGAKTIAVQPPLTTAQTAGAQGTPAATANVIWASGKLVPAQWAALSPAASGTVATVRVAEGDRVATGDVLVELENASLQRQVDAAMAAMDETRAAQAKLLAGATRQQVAQAQAEVASAEAGLAVAQAAVKQAQQGAAAAEAQTAIAQAQYAELASRPLESEKVTALRQVELAQAAVKTAQSAYDQVKGRADIGARPEALALEQATIQLESAKAAYNTAAKGATPEQLAVAAAQVRAGQSQALVAASQVPTAEAGVQAAQAQVARARAGLDALLAGPTVEDQAVAESRVKSAQAQLRIIEAQLAQTRITAPFAGQVGNVLVRPGELAVPGQPALMLGDTGRLRVETTDLRETDVTRLDTGLPVEVTFDALPGRSFQGQIIRVAPMSTVEKGSTNYTVIVNVTELDQALRWGMTAFVNIQPK
jgi:HlyD family secretion protein